MKKRCFLIIVFLLSFRGFQDLKAQFVLDNTFNSMGTIALDPSGMGGLVKKVLIQPDGKIVLCGYTSVGVTSKFLAARLDSLGQLDQSFGTNGFSIIDINGMDSRCFSADLQPDGKIVLSGYVIAGPPTERDIVLVRLDVNGNPDGSFGTSGIVITPATVEDDVIYACKVLPGGQIIVGGKTGSGINANVLMAQYNIDGTADFSFGSLGVSMFDIGNSSEEEITSIEISPNGRIFAGGYQFLNSLAKGFILQVLPDGSMDMSFGVNGVFVANVSGTNDAVKAMTIDVDGNIFVTGQGNNSSLMFLYKVLPDGFVDSTYAINGLALNNSLTGGNAIAIDNLGRIWVAGSDAQDFGLVKYRENGQPDTTIANGGVLTTDFSGNLDIAYSILIQPDGKVIAGGSAFVGANNLFSASRYVETIVSSKNEELEENEIVLVPNPAQDQVKISMNEQEFVIAQFQLIDLTGRVLLSGQLPTSRIISVLGVPEGIYCLRVTDQQGNQRSHKLKISR